MRRTNKKGFTIVELVIVIAVIAILAAVLIPTFASLVDKANRSADMQAVRQMNTALAVNEVTKGKDITQVRAALAENDIDIEDYHPLASNTYFFWDPESNRVVYTDENYNVLFPEGYETADQKKWVSLSGEIPEKKVTIPDSGEVTVGSAGELYYVMNNAASKSVTTITLKENFNAMGASISIEKLTNDLTIEGEGTEPIKIQNMTQLSAATTETTGETSLGKVYGSGFIQEVGEKIGENKYKEVSLTLKNITIDGATIGDLETGSVGALIGRVLTGATVQIENCTVTNTTVYGKNKVGGLIGAIAGGAKVNITGCKLENVTVNCSEGQAATVIGCVYGNPTVTIDKEFGDDWVVNCATSLVKGEYDRDTIDVSGQGLTIVKGNTSSKVSGITKLVAELSKEGKAETTTVSGMSYTNYRMYIENAYMTVQATDDTNASNITAGATTSGATMTKTKLTGTGDDGNFTTYGNVVQVGDNSYYAPILNPIN